MSETSKFLTFLLARELYGVEIKGIREIVEQGNLTQVPMMPPFVRGVINLRGNVVPVVDLALRFGRDPTEIAHRTCLVIVELESEHEQRLVGFLVDAVNEVIDLSLADIEPAPNFGTNLCSDFVRGFIKVEGEFLILLAIQEILAFHEPAISA